MGIRDGSNERGMRNRFGATTTVGPHPSEKVCKKDILDFLSNIQNWQWECLGNSGNYYSVTVANGHSVSKATHW